MVMSNNLEKKISKVKSRKKNLERKKFRKEKISKGNNLEKIKSRKL